MISEPKKIVSISIPTDLYERYAILSKETNRTVPAYIRQILKRYLQQRDNNPDTPEKWWNID